MDSPQSLICSSCPIFPDAMLNGCPADAVDRALCCKKRLIFDTDQPIIREGAPIDGVYCIFSGRVALTKLLPNGDEAVTAIAAKADLIGVPGIFTAERYINGSRTLEPTTVCFIPKDEFLELARLYPAIIVRATMWLGERIEKLERHIEGAPLDGNGIAIEKNDNSDGRNN